MRAVHRGGDGQEPARRLVASKYRRDTARRQAGTLPVHPAAFVEYALPFAATDLRERTSGEIGLVPSDLVIGATWNGDRWDPLPEGPTAHALCDRLDETVRRQTESWPLLHRVGSLPLFFATEGKNRVELYQRLGRPILGEVRGSPHPPSSELTVRLGEAVAGVARRGEEAGLLVLLEPAAADLLLETGACAADPLTTKEEAKLLRQGQRRERYLNVRW